MKYSKTLFGIFMGFAVLVQVNQAIDPVTAVNMVGAVIKGANELLDLFKKVDDLFLKPIMNKVNEEINKIDTKLEGLKEEEKQLVLDARINLVQGRYDIKRIRMILTILADETITRAHTMRIILKKILEDKVMKESERLGVGIMVRKMTDILTRSKILLNQALDKYEGIQKQLIVVQVKLTEFGKRVAELSDNSGSRYKTQVDDIRKAVYGASVACIIYPPSCAAIYPIAAAVVETKVKEWSVSINELTKKCQSSKNTATKLAEKVLNDIRYMQNEERLIAKWESKITSMYEDFKNGDYIQNAINMNMFIENYSINQLTDLISACEAYKAHAAHFL